MDLQIREAVKRIRENVHYEELSQKAYDRPVDVWVVTHALAAFERTLISGNSPFDQYYYQQNESAISNEAKEGWEIFKA